jgi:hypothetical protein
MAITTRPTIVPARFGIDENGATTAVNTDEPDESKKQAAFLPAEEPPVEFFNWLLISWSRWIPWLDYITQSLSTTVTNLVASVASLLIFQGKYTAKILSTTLRITSGLFSTDATIFWDNRKGAYTIGILGRSILVNSGTDTQIECQIDPLNTHGADSQLFNKIKDKIIMVPLTIDGSLRQCAIWWNEDANGKLFRFWRPLPGGANGEMTSTFPAGSTVEIGLGTSTDSILTFTSYDDSEINP